VDPEAVYRKLEFAQFSQREQIADEVVRDAPEMIGTLVRGLEHPHENVRLGVIEILRRANYRESLRKLLAHARSREGDERVFAMRAIAEMVQPGDDFLLESANGWLRWGDPFVTVHATKIKSTLTAKAITRTKSAAGGAAPAEKLDKIVIRLFSAKLGPERIELINQIEQRGPQALAAAAKLTFNKGNADLVALMCRAVIRQVRSLPDAAALVAVLEQTRKRLAGGIFDEPIVNAAIDDALIALAGVNLSPAVISRLSDVDQPQLDALVARFMEQPPSKVALEVPKLLDALARKPQLWASLGPVLAYTATHVRESTKVELRKATELVIDDLRAGKPLPPVTVVSALGFACREARRGAAEALAPGNRAAQREGSGNRVVRAVPAVGDRRCRQRRDRDAPRPAAGSACDRARRAAWLPVAVGSARGDRRHADDRAALSGREEPTARATRGEARRAGDQRGVRARRGWPADPQQRDRTWRMRVLLASARTGAPARGTAMPEHVGIASARGRPHGPRARHRARPLQEMRLGAPSHARRSTRHLRRLRCR
jgi:hypothetical protein